MFTHSKYSNKQSCILTMLFSFISRPFISLRSTLLDSTPGTHSTPPPEQTLTPNSKDTDQNRHQARRRFIQEREKLDRQETRS